MIWNDLPLPLTQLRQDEVGIFSEYPTIVQAIESDPLGLAAASHLRARLVHRDGLPEMDRISGDSVLDEFHGVLAVLHEHPGIESASCVAPPAHSYDSMPYLIHSTSLGSPGLATSLQEATDLIIRTPYANVVTDLASTAVVALRRRSFPETNESYTVRDIRQTIYSDIYEHPLLTAESLVHEMAHLKLNVFMHRESVKVDAGSKFYSPWKETERPAVGLLHSIVAFCDVIGFLKAAAGVVSDDMGQRYLAMKVPFERRNLRLIADTVPALLDSVNNEWLQTRISSAMAQAAG